MTREECAAIGHVWFAVVAGMAECARCGTEVFDLDADPIVVDLGDGSGTPAAEPPPDSACKPAGGGTKQ